MEYVSTGTRLYSDNPVTYTRCQEKYGNEPWQMVIGGFAVGGPVVSHYQLAVVYNHGGLACLRKF